MGVPAWPRGSLQCSAWFCGNYVQTQWIFLMALLLLSPHVSGTSGVPSSCHSCGSPRVAQPVVLLLYLFPTFLGGVDPLVLPGITSVPPGISGCLSFGGSSWCGGAAVSHIPVPNPVPLSPACVFRYNVLSLVYLLFLLLLPWFPGPSPRVTAGKGLTWGCRAGAGGVGTRGAATPLPRAP